MNVIVIKVGKRDNLEIKKAIESIFDMFLPKIPVKISQILIKPNLCYYSDYSTGETTDPIVVDSLIDYIREHINTNSQIYVAESDATAMRTKYVFKALGYEKLAKEKHVNLINLSEMPFTEVKLNGYYLKTFKKPTIFDEADLYINLPKIKLHPLTKISCALKNQYGCNPISYKIQYHPHLDEVIADINSVLKPGINIADGIILKKMSGPFYSNILMASKDPVALDSVVAKFANYNPRKVRHIMLSSKVGIGTLNPSIIGEEITVKLRDKNLSYSLARSTKKLIYQVYKNIMNLLLKIDCF